MPDRSPNSPLLELTSRPDLGVLIGRWQYQSASPAELRACYQQLADLSLGTDCRFWLRNDAPRETGASTIFSTPKTGVNSF